MCYIINYVEASLMNQYSCIPDYGKFWQSALLYMFKAVELCILFSLDVSVSENIWNFHSSILWIKADDFSLFVNSVTIHTSV